MIEAVSPGRRHPRVPNSRRDKTRGRQPDWQAGRLDLRLTGGGRCFRGP
jgi:hypothetical protein